MSDDEPDDQGKDELERDWNEGEDLPGLMGKMFEDDADGEESSQPDDEAD